MTTERKLAATNNRVGTAILNENGAAPTTKGLHRVVQLGKNPEGRPYHVFRFFVRTHVLNAAPFCLRFYVSRLSIFGLT